jgi:hypothetical protein
MISKNRKRRRLRKKVNSVLKKNQSDSFNRLDAAILHESRLNRLPREERQKTFGPDVIIRTRSDKPVDNGKPFNRFRKSQKEKDALKLAR